MELFEVVLGSMALDAIGVLDELCPICQKDKDECLCDEEEKE